MMVMMVMMRDNVDYYSGDKDKNGDDDDDEGSD